MVNSQSGGQVATTRAGSTVVNATKKSGKLSARFRVLLTSEWLRRLFIVCLAAALIGLAASTYYHFADQKQGLPFFGTPAKDGRINGALNVNLRSDPGGSVLAEVPAGTRVRLIEERGGWLRVRILDWAGAMPDNPPDAGWVDRRFVKFE